MMKIRIPMMLSALAIVAACAQQEEPATIAPEPVYDKYGNVVSTVDPMTGVVMIDTDGDGVGDIPAPQPAPEPEPEPDPETGPPNTNQNRNQNQSQGG